MEAGHRVFYLSNNLVDDSQPGFNLEQLDDGGRLFQVSLNAAGAPEIYYGMPSAETVAQLRRSFGVLMQWRSEEHTSELQSLMRNSYAVFCLKTKTKQTHN